MKGEEKKVYREKIIKVLALLRLLVFGQMGNLRIYL